MSRTKVFYVRKNMKVFRSQQSMQRGYGIGGLFRSLIRTATPMLKKGLISVGQKALSAGADALSDIQENNVSINKALKKQFQAAISKPINRRARKRKSTTSVKPAKRKVVKYKVEEVAPQLR